LDKPASPTKSGCSQTLELQSCSYFLLAAINITCEEI
jgi:hypothetical protein